MSRPHSVPTADGGRQRTPQLQRRGSVVMATGEDQRAHRRACRRAVAPEDGGCLLLRTGGRYTATVCCDEATRVRYAPATERDPDRGAAPGTPGARRADVVRTRTGAGLAVAITNTVTRHEGDGPLDICVDSLLPVRAREGADDLYWVLRTLALALDGGAWTCHLHLPVEAGSVPPAFADLADDRVALDDGPSPRPGDERATD